MLNSRLLSGKADLKNVVSVEHHGDKARIFIETEDGVRDMIAPARYYTLYPSQIEGSVELEGNLHYKYMKDFESKKDWNAQSQLDRSRRRDAYNIYNPKEAYLTRSGVTYFKGMSINDVSILSFDIETNGLTMDSESKIFMIACTYSKGGKREQKAFFTIEDFLSYVRSKDPSIILGHNIFGFDLPYLRHMASGLPMGRDGSGLKFARNTSRVRKDGSQSYDYNNVICYGRELIDTFHLALKVGQTKGYDNYSIKTLAKHEGVAKEERVYLDASKIAQDWYDDDKRKLIIQYALDDTEEALDYFYAVAPAYFYYTQSIPKSFQQVISGASGSQLNALMVRSYLQERHSIPIASERADYEGAISFGNAGIYQNVKKVDVASMYPSIILEYGICDKEKDPKGNFIEVVSQLTKERLENKKLAKDTGKQLYKDLEQAQKIMINSAYGFMGASGLNFNAPDQAAEITRIGREILTRGIKWAEDKGYEIVNVDTDSFSYSADSNFDDDITDLNTLFPDRIIWENDGFYDQVIVVKAKNYVLQQGDKVKVKGSALKATMKEPALKEFIDKLIDLMLAGRADEADGVYNRYAAEIMNVHDIARWSSKKTITKAVLNPQRTNEQRIYDAIQGSDYKEGDKIYVFFETDKTLSLRENFRGQIDQKKLLGKLYQTVKIFEPVLDLSTMANYSLKRHALGLSQLCNRLPQEMSKCTPVEVGDQAQLFGSTGSSI